MSQQHDYNILNGTGQAVREDINDVLRAIKQCNFGPSAPAESISAAYMLWVDTSNAALPILKIRDKNDTNWISLLNLDDGAPSGGVGLSNVVEDTTPELGGNLNLNGKAVNNTGSQSLFKNIALHSTDCNVPAETLTGNLPTAIKNQVPTSIVAVHEVHQNTRKVYNTSGVAWADMGNDFKNTFTPVKANTRFFHFMRICAVNGGDENNSVGIRVYKDATLIGANVTGYGSRQPATASTDGAANNAPAETTWIWQETGNHDNETELNYTVRVRPMNHTTVIVNGSYINTDSNIYLWQTSDWYIFEIDL